jgi:hypothetical protein
MQNIDEFAFSTLAERKPVSISDSQRPDVDITVLPRDPPVLVAMAPI